jgi:hypothetical protein
MSSSVRWLVVGDGVMQEQKLNTCMGLRMQCKNQVYLTALLVFVSYLSLFSKLVPHQEIHSE